MFTWIYNQVGVKSYNRHLTGVKSPFLMKITWCPSAGDVTCIVDKQDLDLKSLGQISQWASCPTPSDRAKSVPIPRSAVVLHAYLCHSGISMHA